MTSRPQFGREYILQEFEAIGHELETEVTAYLVGGGAMSFRDLKDTTKDIDLVVTSSEEYERLLGVLNGMGYEEATELDDEYKRLGARHCVKNDDRCQIDLFYKQIANKLFFSEGMEERSEELATHRPLSVRIASLEDIFLFKSVAERPDDIDDMATLVQSSLDFEEVKDEIETQVQLLNGEYFTTTISGSLNELEEKHGVQPPIGEFIDEYYARYMKGWELWNALDDETPRSVQELAVELELGTAEIEDRIEYLERFNVAERMPEGILDTGSEDRFERS